MPFRTPARVCAVLTTAGMAVALAACGGSSDGASGSPKPAADAHAAKITVTADKGCTSDQTSLASGPITFSVTNQDATAVSEVELQSGARIVGEKENLPPGFSGSFAVNVPAGSYTLYCPGGTPERTTLTVTGAAQATSASDSSALLATGTQQYADYVNTQIGYLLTTSQALSKALSGTDLAAAQDAYMKARPYYEKIEPVAESFTAGKVDLDAAIDARSGDVPAKDWTGFHPIEKGLFQDKSLKGLAPLGTGLVANVTKLQGLTKDLTYQPFELANGAQELLDEVSSSKITGEEERYSHIDLLDFQGNDEGAEQAFADLQPGLTSVDPVLAKQVSDGFSKLDDAVDAYRAGGNPSGFKLYNELSAQDKKTLAAAVKAVQEPLSQVASKVAH